MRDAERQADDLPPPPGRRVIAALRELLAPPGTTTYWSALERRILARIAEDADWTVPFRRWIGAGLVAAAVAVIAVAAALTSAHEAEARAAVTTMIDEMQSVPAQVASEIGGPEGREATLRYVVSP